MRLRGSAELLEDRRRRALVLLDEGRSRSKVARHIGCSARSVMRWHTHAPFDPAERAPSAELHHALRVAPFLSWLLHS